MVPLCQDTGPAATAERRRSHTGGMSNSWQSTSNPAFGSVNAELSTQHEMVLQVRLDTWGLANSPC